MNCPILPQRWGETREFIENSAPKQGVTQMLTESKISQLKAKKTTYEVNDSDCLYLRVSPHGVKTWFYRSRRNGDIKVTLGHWPELCLFDARLARDKERVKGLRPKASDVTFQTLAEDYILRIVKPHQTAKRVAVLSSWLERFVFPYLRNRKVETISPPDVLTVARSITDLGYLDTAHRVIGLIGRIMRYGIPLGVVSSDPTRDLRGALPAVIVCNQAAITTPLEIGALMRAINNLPSPIIRLALLLEANLFLRPSELRLGLWSEIDFERQLWTIPAERMKKRREHLVPLSRQTIELLSQLRLQTGKSGYLFPSSRTPSRPISDMTLIAGLRRLGYERGEMTVHGFRSMASTRLNEAQWPSDIIELQLAHVEGNAVRATYNRARYLDQRRVMMQWWSDYLDTLRDGRPAPQKP